MNEVIARQLRTIGDMRENSWDGERYTLSYADCITSVVGSDPIAKIYACLFTAGYCDMWDFCDEVLSR